MSTALVVGALPGQGRALRARLAGRVAVDWVEGGRRRPHVAPGYDVYVLWTRFCSHRLQDMVRRAAGGAPILLHGGGLALMAERIAAAAGKEGA